MVVKVIYWQLFLQFINLVSITDPIFKSEHLTFVSNITLIDLKMLKNLGLFVEMMTKWSQHGKILNSCLMKGVDKVVRITHTYA